MENPEETLQVLDEWVARRARSCGGASIGAMPRQLDEYLAHVARTGDPVFHWASVKPLIKEKLLNAVNEFHETAPGLDVPLAPNVDPFNYEAMRALLLERLDSFNAAPFTVQRLCELLTAPRKQYNRIDKFMRAVEKNVLVVSTREPGSVRREDNESIERALNGSDANSDCGVDVDMEDSSWRDLRQPTIDPLAGASHCQSERLVDASAPLVDASAPPVSTTPAVTEHSSPPSEEKMDDTPDVTADQDKPVETVEQKEETASEDHKTELSQPIESMDVEISKEPEPQPIEPETTETHKETKEENADHVSAPVTSSSEDDSNSNPEPPASISEPEPERELEQKTESTTSGEDSSSSNSSENTDGESERGGVDSASRSPERSGASEGDSSCEVPEQEAHKPTVEEKPKEIESAAPTPVQTEHYTIADIETQAEGKVAVEETPPVEGESIIPPLTEEKVENTPEESVTPAEEPMPSEVTEEPSQPS